MNKASNKLHTLISTIRTLRGKNGCPWDIKQTPSSLIKYISSESEELIQAIRNEDKPNMCEELGDVLYLVIMLSEINRDEGNFDLDEVIDNINAKLIRRHPHVFAGQTYESEEQLAAQWQAIKAAEKSKKSV